MLVCLHSWSTSGDIVIYMTISWDAVQVFFSLLGDCDKNSLRVLSVENTFCKQGRIGEKKTLSSSQDSKPYVLNTTGAAVEVL